MNSWKYSFFIKMEFVFQDIHKDLKHLQLWKAYKSISHDCYIFGQQYNILVLKSYCNFTLHFILGSNFGFAAIQPLACFCTSHFGACSSLLCIALHFLAIYDNLSSLQCSKLEHSFCSDKVFSFFSFTHFVSDLCQQALRVFISVILNFVQHRMLGKCYS